MIEEDHTVKRVLNCGPRVKWNSGKLKADWLTKNLSIKKPSDNYMSQIF
jgi:hypothetical protein